MSKVAIYELFLSEINFITFSFFIPDIFNVWIQSVDIQSVIND